MCREDVFLKDRFLSCTQCGSMGHPKCLDMTEEMFQTAQAYDWMCMECKPCSVCKNLDGEVSLSQFFSLPAHVQYVYP